MNIRTLIVSLTAAGLFLAAAQAELNIDDTRGIWLLDEGNGTEIKDNSGKENHGELKSGEWVDGPNNRPALKLNGVDDRVVIPDSESLYIDGAWTVTAWVNGEPG